MYKISVVICTYNRDKFLDICLESLFKQNLPSYDFEIIVVDNNSTDNTKEVFDTKKLENPSFEMRYIEEKTQGLSYARNTGWQAANSPYVYYLDDDGKASPQLLGEFLRLFSLKENIAACGGKIIVEYDPEKPDWLPHFFERFYGDYSRGEEVVECEYVPGGNSTWSVDFLKESGGFATELGRVGQDGAGCEESLLNARAVQMGYTLMYSPDALMYHYAGPSRLNIKWLFQRMRGQGKSSTKLILMNSDNKKRVAIHCVKVDVKLLLKYFFIWKYTEKNLKQELVSRASLSIEKIQRIKDFSKYLAIFWKA
ncbi:MAG: glycosyltransferase involved in cell wall biosynthesis [Bacteriovoracaceae bacterium]|jgi:glycosyltransferase involved in cell wall biosynthesis